MVENVSVDSIQYYLFWNYFHFNLQNFLCTKNYPHLVKNVKAWLSVVQIPIQ